MIAPPAFSSPQEHLSRLEDVDFWWPYVAEILLIVAWKLFSREARDACRTAAGSSPAIDNPPPPV